MDAVDPSTGKHGCPFSTPRTVPSTSGAPSDDGVLPRGWRIGASTALRRAPPRQLAAVDHEAGPRLAAQQPPLPTSPSTSSIGFGRSSPPTATATIPAFAAQQPPATTDQRQIPVAVHLADIPS
ncbi:hypothetical protein ACQJBY_044457 [Aegilops geniculata]